MGSLIILPKILRNISDVPHLGHLRSKNPKNKFENLCDIVGNNGNVLSVAGTKLDPSFLNAQFLLPGFHEPLR